MFGVLILISCQKESNLNRELSEADKVALEGMEEGYETAKLYNDSLVWCNNISNNCSKNFKAYCDSIYHEFDDSYEMHHDNYSHNNLEDDHHHSAISEHKHGNDEHGDGEDDDQHGHNIESHYKMEDLRKMHKTYHL
tara:strand:- start:1662 stop:2072 length:411 start_codon:yes stop_codon:yes gene_type:complete